MALKRSGGNPDDTANGVLSDDFTSNFFSQQEQNSYGASELIKAGKTDRPDDQLLRTCFQSQKQAQAFASLLSRARRFNVVPANEFCTFLMEALTSVKGLSRRQYLQGLTNTYDWNDANRMSNPNTKTQNQNQRPIQAGD